jgi:hypothetical protein
MFYYSAVLGGVIVTEIIEYELRTQQSGERLGSVRVGE